MKSTSVTAAIGYNPTNFLNNGSKTSISYLALNQSNTQLANNNCSRQGFDVILETPAENVMLEKAFSSGSNFDLDAI